MPLVGQRGILGPVPEHVNAPEQRIAGNGGTGAVWRGLPTR